MKYLSAWAASVLLGLAAASPIQVQHGTELGRRAEKHANDPAGYIPTGGEITVGAGPNGIGVGGAMYGPNGQMTGSASLTGAGLTGTVGGQTYGAPPPPAYAPGYAPPPAGVPAYAPPQYAPPQYAPAPAYAPPQPAYAPPPAYAPGPGYQGGEMPGMMPGSSMNGGGGGAGLLGGAGGPCIGVCLDKKPEKGE